MTTLTAYDLRQLRLIEKRISFFENRKLDLYGIICDLSGILNALESVDDSWKNGFRARINALEFIHDCIEDGSILCWKGNYKEDLHNITLKLKKPNHFYFKWISRKI